MKTFKFHIFIAALVVFAMILLAAPPRPGG